MKFINTFRGRLLLILALLLFATLGVQYYLNLLTQQENNDLREAQTQALVSGIAIGSNGITSQEYMQDLIKRDDQTFFDESMTERVKDVIIVNNQWKITDSLNPDYLPDTDDQDNIVYKDLSDLTDLPPLMEGSRIGPDITHFPNRPLTPARMSDDEAHAIPIETSQGRYYVMVLLKNDRSAAARRA